MEKTPLLIGDALWKAICQRVLDGKDRRPFSLADIHRGTGLHQTTVSHIMSNLKQPTAPTLYALCRFIGVKPEDIDPRI